MEGKEGRHMDKAPESLYLKDEEGLVMNSEVAGFSVDLTCRALLIIIFSTSVFSGSGVPNTRAEH